MTPEESLALETPSVRAAAMAHPDAIGPFAKAFNEYGTPVTVARCYSCEVVFTVCPPVQPGREDQWTGCLADTCESYDIARDIGIFFQPLAEAGLVTAEEPGLP